jgi:hypothetical protein
VPAARVALAARPEALAGPDVVRADLGGRLPGVGALLLFGIIVAVVGCHELRPNGEACLKDRDCESGRCRSSVCAPETVVEPSTTSVTVGSGGRGGSAGGLGTGGMGGAVGGMGGAVVAGGGGAGGS